MSVTVGEMRRQEEQLRLALEGGAWHGPSVLEALAGVSAEQASSHPSQDAHSIWELVLHIGSDYALVLRRLGGDGRQLTPEEDWPSCPPATAENWQDRKDAGVHEVRLEASSLASGVYLYRLEAGSFTQTRKLVLIR